jgi:hypothetical protein
MNEDLKRNPSKAFMLFTRCYIYVTNTKKSWVHRNFKRSLEACGKPN